MQTRCWGLIEVAPADPPPPAPALWPVVEPRAPLPIRIALVLLGAPSCWGLLTLLWR